MDLKCLNLNSEIRKEHLQLTRHNLNNMLVMSLIKSMIMICKTLKEEKLIKKTDYINKI
jgi:hypothetical protein